MLFSVQFGRPLLRVGLCLCNALNALQGFTQLGPHRESMERLRWQLSARREPSQATCPSGLPTCLETLNAGVPCRCFDLLVHYSCSFSTIISTSLPPPATLTDSTAFEKRWSELAPGSWYHDQQTDDLAASSLTTTPRIELRRTFLVRHGGAISDSDTHIQPRAPSGG